MPDPGGEPLIQSEWDRLWIEVAQGMDDYLDACYAGEDTTTRWQWIGAHMRRIHELTTVQR